MSRIELDKKRRGFLQLSGRQNWEWAKAVGASGEMDRLDKARPKCPKCQREFSFYEINKARSNGRIRCPQCRRETDLKDLGVLK